MSARPDDLSRRRLELRADELRATLHGCPAWVTSDRDLVVLIDGYPDPWIIPPECAASALYALGGSELVRDIARLEPVPGHALIVIAIGGWVQVSRVALRPLAKGGAA
jgi:hypothetical protein